MLDAFVFAPPSLDFVLVLLVAEDEHVRVLVPFALAEVARVFVEPEVLLVVAPQVGHFAVVFIFTYLLFLDL